MILCQFQIPFICSGCFFAMRYSGLFANIDCLDDPEKISAFAGADTVLVAVFPELFVLNTQCLYRRNFVDQFLCFFFRDDSTENLFPAFYRCKDLSFRLPSRP